MTDIDVAIESYCSLATKHCPNDAVEHVGKEAVEK